MRRIFVIVVVAGVLLPGCELFEPSAEDLIEVAKPAPKKAEVKAEKPKPPLEMRPSTEVAAHMRKHFNLATHAREALVDGDLDAMKGFAKGLVKHEPDPKLSEKAVAYVEAMTNAAKRASTVKDLDQGAAAVGEMALSCGGCHEATGATPRFKVVPKPATSADVKAQMALHQWAADRLWEGVVGPSPAAWDLGVESMKVAPLCVDAAARDAAIPGDGKELQQKVNALAIKAGNTATLADRAKLYGEFLSTCANCHTSGC